MAKLPKLPGGFGDMFQKAMADAQRAEQELAQMRIDGVSPGGHVRVTADGLCSILSVKISKDIVDPDDVETLEDLVTVAVRDAVEKANKTRQERLSSAIPGMGAGGGLSGLF